ncbi:MAG: ABC transporter permease [Chloroflexi bacterium]|nr:ABC transporter permease [Chloroflexota bacterium]
MTGSSASIGVYEGGVALPRRRATPLRAIVRFCRQKPLGAISGLIIVAVVLAAGLADWVAPSHYRTQDIPARLQGPSPQHFFGTDDLGRDIFSRVIYGSRISLLVGLVAVALGVVHGSIWGFLSGYLGGKLDMTVQRLMDAILAVPLLVMALVVVATLGASLFNVILALAFILTPRANRLLRGSVLSARENIYVEAARAVGCSSWRIALRHILPNVTAPIIVLATISLGSAIITEASLSFLGMGVPPPFPTWGGMLSGEGRSYMIYAPWIAIFPGLAITITVLAFNLLGDALRDVLDPRLRS